MALAALLAGVSCMIACGGGGGTATPEPSATTVSDPPSPNPQPTIDGSRFTFPARGYASVIPDGWHANPNSLLAGAQTVDTFFSVDTVDGVQANISVTCEKNDANVPTEQFVTTRLATLAALSAIDVKMLGAVTVAGVQGQKVSYTLVRDAKTLRKTDVMFATARCGWTLALATAPAAETQHQDLFERFLQSFSLIGDAVPLTGAPRLPLL